MTGRRRGYSARRATRSTAAPLRSAAEEDRHHFRFIVSPEDAVDMADLKSFARELMGQMEKDLGTKLDWAAVDHWNTDNPHVHHHPARPGR